MGKLEELYQASTCIQMTADTASAFSAFDRNGDGCITQSELYAVFQKLDPGKFTKDQVRSLFQAMDRDNDKTVDYAEFVEFIFAAGTGIRGSKASAETREQAHAAIAGIAERASQ